MKLAEVKVGEYVTTKIGSTRCTVRVVREIVKSDRRHAFIVSHTGRELPKPRLPSALKPCKLDIVIEYEHHRVEEEALMDGRYNTALGLLPRRAVTIGSNKRRLYYEVDDMAHLRAVANTLNLRGAEDFGVSRWSVDYYAGIEGIVL